MQSQNCVLVFTSTPGYETQRNTQVRLAGSEKKQEEISNMQYLLGTNISPQIRTFESMIFPFPFGGICDGSLEGIL